ncbi:MAG TPA: glycosyltransferase family 2 protein [Streptosporangiaceae bacterium]|nr:glycosyltransferase family 2 protein [Streptosporangiaceae bacterium]
MRLPLARPPLDGGPASGDGRVVPANGQGKLADGNGAPQAHQGANGTALRGVYSTAPRAGPDFMTIADGMAIAPKVSVVLPVMNEAANLPGVFATLPAWVHEIVLVDGRSTDDTIEVARQLRSDVKVVLQGGIGKGDALAAGFAVASGDIIVAIDGDGSTDGKEIVRFVSALLAGADFAKGSRFNSAGRSDDITTFRRYGNKMLNLTVNRLFGTSFSDLCYGYNAFWSRHLDALALDSPGFEIETLMSIRAARAGLKIYEVPSHERQRLHGASNLSAVKDGWRVLRLIAAEKREARRSKVRRPKPFMAPGRLQAEK